MNFAQSIYDHSNENLIKPKYIEHINADKLNAVLQLKNLDSKIHNQLSKMQKIMMKVGDEYVLNVGYFNNKQNIGRVFPTNLLSLGCLRKDIRQFLIHDLYFDIDIVNCHNSVLQCVCNYYRIGCDVLTDYCIHRNTYFEKLQKLKPQLTKDVTKDLFNMLRNGGTIRNFEKANNIMGLDEIPIIINYKNEMRTIITKLKDILGTAKYEELTKDSQNKDGTFISQYLSTWEVAILEKVVNLTIGKLKLNDAVRDVILSHDGFMIHQKYFSDEYGLNNLIEDINAELISLGIGEYIKLINKSMTRHNKIYDLLRTENIDWNLQYVNTFYDKYGINEGTITELKPNDNTLADLFYRNQKNNYIYCNDHYYHLIDNGLYRKLSNAKVRYYYNEYMKDFIEKIEGLTEDYTIMIVKEGDKTKKQLLKNTFRKLQTFEDKLLNNGAKRKNIISRLEEVYCNDEFEEIINTDNNILGFNNGVLDLKTMQFRKANNNEFVTMSCGYNWFYTNTDEEVIKRTNELKQRLENLLEKKEDLDYILKALSRSLKGSSNYEECCHFLKGCGSNGKGIIMSLMKSALGEYYGTLTYKYFVHETPSNRDPTLYGMKNKRFIEVQEPNQKFTFNADVFKRTTGNDLLTVRTNYQTSDTSFKLAHLWICSNHIVEFDSDTGGNSMKRRVRGINFPYTFKYQHEIDTNNEFEKVRDDNFKDKIDEGYYNQAFMNVLIEYYKLYKKEGLELTPNLKADTHEYIKHLSPDRAWFDDNVREVNVYRNDKANLCVVSLRHKHNRDMGVKWSGKYFNKKLKEFYGINCISRKTTGYDIYGNKLKNKNCLRGFTLNHFEKEEMNFI